jgi:hypothetical protein
MYVLPAQLSAVLAPSCSAPFVNPLLSNQANARLLASISTGSVITENSVMMVRYEKV